MTPITKLTRTAAKKLPTGTGIWYYNEVKRDYFYGELQYFSNSDSLIFRCISSFQKTYDGWFMHDWDNYYLATEEEFVLWRLEH